MAPSKSKSTFSFPRGPMSLVQAVREAETAILADYMADVNGLAQAWVAESIAKSTHTSKWAALLDEMLEKCDRVMYEREAKLGMMVSPNATAAFDEDYDVECEDGIPWSTLMYYAMRRDVVLALEAENVEIDAFETDDEVEDGEIVEDDDAEDGDDDEETDDNE